MVFNATFNNISVILWGSVLQVEEARIPENHQPVASHKQTLSHNVVSSTPHHEPGFELTTFVVIGTDCIGSYKSNNNMITTMTTPCTIIWLLLHQYEEFILNIKYFFFVGIWNKWLQQGKDKGGCFRVQKRNIITSKFYSFIHLRIFNECRSGLFDIMLSINTFNSFSAISQLLKFYFILKDFGILQARQMHSLTSSPKDRLSIWFISYSRWTPISKGLYSTASSEIRSCFYTLGFPCFYVNDILSQSP